MVERMCLWVLFLVIFRSLFDMRMNVFYVDYIE